MSPYYGAEVVRLELTSDIVATCFQNRLLILPDDFRSQAAGAGIEPTSRRSERRILPLDDPAMMTESLPSFRYTDLNEPLTCETTVL